MARRGAAQGEVDLDAIESFSEESQRDLGQETLDAAIAALTPEDDSAKPCPKCKQFVPVKAKNRARHILTRPVSCGSRVTPITAAWASTRAMSS